MTQRAVIRALLDGRATTSLAAFWKHHPVADQSAAGLAAATLDWHAATGSALVKLTPAGNYQVAQRGLDEDWCGDPLGRRTIRGRFVEHPQDWQAVPGGTTALELAMVEAARQVRRVLGPQPVLLASVFSPVTQALMLAGPERLQQHLHEYPGRVSTALERLSVQTLSLLDQYAAAGVDGVYYASQHHEQHLFDAQSYQRWAQPFDAAMYARAEQFEMNIMHIHGTGIHLHGLPPAGQWMIHYEMHDGNPSAADFRSLSDCCVAPGLPLERLTAGLPDLQTHKREVLAVLGQSAALFSAACVVPLVVPASEVKGWITALQETGTC